MFCACPQNSSLVVQCSLKKGWLVRRCLEVAIRRHEKGMKISTNGLSCIGAVRLRFGVHEIPQKMVGDHSR